MKFIIRDHDATKFEQKKDCIKAITESIQKQYETAKIELQVKDQYYNMIEKIKPVMHVVDIAKQAMINVGVTPIEKPIRGGTDGANLSFKGLPCPNIFAGGMNFHGCFEYVPIDSMSKATDVLIEICKLTAHYKE